MGHKYAIFHIEGGLGKHVMATAVASAIKSNHTDRELIVVCGYPEVFIDLPFVHRVYPIGKTPYFYQEYIEDKDTLIFRGEPYFQTKHVVHKEPLIETWCDMFGVEYNGEQPTISLNYRQKVFNKNMWVRSKPIMILQTNGGPKQEGSNYSWTRDMPIELSRKIVTAYAETYHIIQVCNKEEQGLKDPRVEVFHDKVSNPIYFGLVEAATKIVAIDSSIQHIAKAFDKEATVVWVATRPSIFGYELHKNIVAKLPKKQLPNAYMFDYDFNGSMLDCPFDKIEDVLDFDAVIQSVGE